MNPGRIAAARVLMQVEEGAHLEDALAEFAPPGHDRTLAWFLAYGVQRHRASIDAALRAFLRQPMASLDPPVRAVLRLGAFEKLYARTRDHAAVHQAVEVARRVKAGRASGMVNAVLRRVREPRDLSDAEALEHPAWLVERWQHRYGDEATAAWCRANNEPPPLFVVERRPGAVPDAMGDSATAVSLGDADLAGVYRVDATTGSVPELPGFEAGAFWVQDAAAVAVADLAAEAAGEGGRVLDACAAPGGKSFRLAARGARVSAVDRSANRLQRVREGASRLGLSLEAVRAHDWAEGPLADVAPFDVVLVDAPCTGLGTVGRHPEIRWRRQPDDLPGAAERQRAILEGVCDHVAPGGSLVYAVCSPEPEEGEQVVEAFLAAHPEFSRAAVWTSAPPSDGVDAHWAARLEKRPS